MSSVQADAVAINATDAGLGVSKAPCLAALENAAEQGNDAHRMAAVQALGKIGDVSAIGALQSALKDPDQDIREAAVRSLSVMGAKDAIPDLIDSLRFDPAGDIKVAVLETLVKFNAREAAPVLLELAQQRGDDIQWEDISMTGWDDWLDVQLLAVSALGQLGVSGGTDAIVSALADTEAQDLSVAATRAFSALGTAGRKALFECLKTDDARLRRQAASQLVASTTDAEELTLFRSLIRDTDADVRRSAVKVLAANSQSNNWLITACTDPSPSVRTAIVDACGLTLDRRVFTFLGDSSDEVRLVTLAMVEREAPKLAQQGRDELAAFLMGRSSDTTARVEAERVSVLATLGGEAVHQYLLELVDNKDAPVAARSSAIRALARKPDLQSVEMLIGHIKDDVRQVRLDALSALATLAADENEFADLARNSLLECLRLEVNNDNVVSLVQPDVEDHADATNNSDDTKKPNEILITNSTSTIDDTQSDGQRQQGFPVSTLSAILDESVLTELAENQGDDVELTPEDLQRLEMAAQRRTRKHVSLDPELSVETDVRHFATRVSGGIDNPAITERLLELLLDGRDKEWQQIAGNSLLRSLDSSAPCPEVTSQSLIDVWQSANLALKITLLRLMRHMPGDALDHIMQAALVEKEPSVRLEALQLVPLTTVELDNVTLERLLGDDDSAVRVAALKQSLERDFQKASMHMVPMLFANEGFDRKAVTQAINAVPGVSSQRLLADELIGVLGKQARQRDWCIAMDVLGDIFTAEQINATV